MMLVLSTGDVGAAGSSNAGSSDDAGTGNDAPGYSEEQELLSANPAPAPACEYR